MRIDVRNPKPETRNPQPATRNSKLLKNMFLFFDTETTGLPRNYKAPLTDSANWPRIVQLAWVLYGTDGEELASQSDIIAPDGWVIPPDMIHGISHEQAVAEGQPLVAILADFTAAANRATTLIAHNFDFDRAIVGAEYARLQQPDVFLTRRALCTMKATTDFCRIPSPTGWGYKWPKLIELHRALFGEGFDGAHDALADVRATARCYWELRRRRVVPSEA
jgi:DNA polymerase III subunit epsilon